VSAEWVVAVSRRYRQKSIDVSGLQKYVMIMLCSAVHKTSRSFNSGVEIGNCWAAQLRVTIHSALYLHYAFDLWVNVWRKKWAHGEVVVIRYADDGVPRARKAARLSSA
jgi:hypothetical protein